MSQQFLMQKDVLFFVKRQIKGSVARDVSILLLCLSKDSLEPSGNVCSGKQQQ